MPGEVLALVLVCMGGGDAIKADSANVNGSTNGYYDYGQGNYNGSYSGTVTGTRTQGYAEQVDVELSSDGGRIRLPRITLPLIRGGKDGWFELSNVETTERSITANAKVNFLNKPKVHIDRMTGTISIVGKNGNYIGQCQKVEQAQEAQF